MQVIIQMIFLGLFLFLFVTGKVQLWMGLLLAGIIFSFFLGRIYCGWICSINTVIRGVSWAKKKLGIKDLKSPAVLTKACVRYLVLGLFFVVFIFIMATGKKLPVLPALFVIGIVLTFLFPEELWHRNLCPYGTILSCSAAKTKKSIQINPLKCNNCGACLRVCPAMAIEKNTNKHKIIAKDCLVCMECTRVCRQNAISYTKV